MNRWLKVVCLVLLVLVSAMVLRNATYASVAGGNDPILVANGGNPVPPLPWKNGGNPVPPLPWKNGGNPVPPLPWHR